MDHTQIERRSTALGRVEKDGNEEEEEEHGEGLEREVVASSSSVASASGPETDDDHDDDDDDDDDAPATTAEVVAAAAAVKMAGNEIRRSRGRNAAAESSSSSRIADSKCSCPSSAPPEKSFSSSRSTEAREVHRVTFAEPCNKYVHSDSGIVLSPDDTDYCDVTGADLSDDESGDVDADDVINNRCHARLPPVNTNAVPGPPIIKLHRCRSTESHDNPFLSDGELRRKADYIITHSTFLRTCVRIADPDQLQCFETETSQAVDSITAVEENASQSNSSAPVDDFALELSRNEQDGEGGVPEESPSNTPQRVVQKVDSPPRLNGDMEEPLLAPKKEGNGLENPKSKQSKSRKGICCIVQ